MIKGKKSFIRIIATVICLAIISSGLLFLFSGCNNNTQPIFIEDSLPEGNGKDATVILLGGQSNASGASLDEYLRKNVSKEKYAEYESGYDNVYINYLAGAKKSNAFVKCSVLQGEIEGGFGPELGIADKLNEIYPNRTFFIIKCAWGGSNLYNQWLSPTSFGKTGEFYKYFVNFVNSSLEYLVSKNYNVKVEAMCWMQGESDSVSIDVANDYQKNLKNFIKDIRKELKKYASSNGIAFIDAYIANNPKYWIYYDVINSAKKAVAENSDINLVIDTVDLGLTCANEPENTPDFAHYDSLSQIKLGHLFAENAIRFFDYQ